MSAGARGGGSPVVPLIVRIAGLPASAVDPFGSDLEASLERIAEATSQAERARAALVEVLFAAVNGAPPERRRFLLKVKRDCFNGRELASHRQDPRWPMVLAAAAFEAGAGLDAEEKLTAARAAYAQRYAENVLRERRALAAAAGDRALGRGIALSSVVVAGQIERLKAKDPASWGRRERRLEAVLLRYLCRTALKLSPFATLTRVGIATAMDLPERYGGDSEFQDELRLKSPRACREVSLVRLRRHLVEQWCDLLAEYEPLRSTLQVVVNDTIEPLAADRYRFLTSGRWKGVDADGVLDAVQPALVRVTLKGQLISWLLENLKAPGLVYGDLLGKLESVFPGADPSILGSTVERLVEAQFLRLATPWKSSDLVLEKTLREILERFRDDPRLARITRLLEETVAIEEGFPSAADPAAAIEAGKAASESLWREVAPLAGIDPLSVRHSAEDFTHYFFEDVLLDSGERPGGSLIELQRRRAGKILEQVSPLVRLANLFTFRHDLLYALGALAAREWPGRREIPWLDFFEKAQRLFQEFIRWETGERDYRGVDLSAAFDPFGVAAVARLKSDREMFGGGYRDLFERLPGDIAYADPGRFSAFLDQATSPAAARRDFTAFLQPADAAGREWVLNGIFDGIGRMGSRYTPVMGTEIRDFWTDFFVGRSESAGESGEPIEYVDLYTTSGQSINVHAPQTRRLLVASAESSGLPPERILRLVDLRIRTRGDEPPCLVDSQGKRIVPIYLGATIHRFTPTLYKFLAAFGSGEIRSRYPYLRRPAVDGIEILPRHYLGDVVFARRSWVLSPQAIPDLRGLAEPEAFARVAAWRKALALPRRVFVAEAVSKHSTKPQYIDFTSPSLVELFRGILEPGLPYLNVSEALPAPDQLISDGTGERWAVEFQLDDQGLRG